METKCPVCEVGKYIGGEMETIPPRYKIYLCGHITVIKDGEETYEGHFFTFGKDGNLVFYQNRKTGGRRWSIDRRSGGKR